MLFKNIKKSRRNFLQIFNRTSVRVRTHTSYFPNIKQHFLVIISCCNICLSHVSKYYCIVTIKHGDQESSWHNGTMLPIPKPGKDHSDPSNYRPIVLSSCLCKRMERMINDRLVWYLETKSICTCIQCVFRKNRSMYIIWCVKKLS